VTFAYPAAAQPGLILNPSSLPAGVEAMIDITGINTNFAQGQTTVGFGSSDVFVRRVFWLTPTHLQANVYIPANAVRTFTEVSVITGFQSAVLPGGFQITAPNSRLPVTSPLVTNTVAGQTTIYPGAIVSVFGTNLAQGSTLPAVTFSGTPALVLFASPTQVNLQIPAGLPPGPSPMVLSNALGVSFAVDVNIDPVPTSLSGLLNSAGVLIDSAHPAHAGDIVTLLVSNFADPGAAVSASRVQIAINGLSAQPLIVAPYGTNLFQIQTILPALQPGTQPIALYLDGRMVAQGTITIQ
jgi:uncharacterized protein (TIGR03437 family)